MFKKITVNSRHFVAGIYGAGGDDEYKPTSPSINMWRRT